MNHVKTRATAIGSAISYHPTQPRKRNSPLATEMELMGVDGSVNNSLTVRFLKGEKVTEQLKRGMEGPP